ncbi:Type-2 restriction enzyme KpnI [Methylobacterium hispanicum]|uniref:Type-2 restriction enzyme KpnI n=1 Tax=Methylobacterium hispanicum TaxID=270350 RepID=A0AAV4ZH92_9HYPH|nr:hypothetical protein [Methylobacterium hispanicum]GJD87236.1 Type-2 restriction enzyme KpnI [Methylobacterium hispanicum]
MIPKAKIHSDDPATGYRQASVSKRILALFLANVGKVVTREQIQKAATNPETGLIPENWHQRLSELRTDSGYTILAKRDWPELAASEYVMPTTDQRPTAAKRVMPTAKTWAEVLRRAGNCCQWREDGQPCGLRAGDIDPIGGGTVRLTADHTTPHSINPAADPNDPEAWQALCARHQVTKKNYWDSTTGKMNILGILQNANRQQKGEALGFLLTYFGLETKPKE